MSWTLALLWACTPRPSLTLVEPEPPPAIEWPAAGAPLVALEPDIVDVEPVRVFLDPGHGTGTNTGNRGARCQDEEQAMLGLVDDLMERLPGLGPFEVRSSRPDGERTPYDERVERARVWKATVLVSQHSDARGDAVPWEGEPERKCMRSEDAAGFTVLVSDEGSPAEVLGRARLANAVATRMTEAGFPPYDGRDYGERYEHGEVSGTFLDRRGLLMLRRPAMPSVIVETYHAYDLEEVRRWDEPATVDAFARALAQAILDTQRSPPEDAP